MDIFNQALSEVINKLKPATGKKPDAGSIARAKTLLTQSEDLCSQAQNAKDKVSLAKNVHQLSMALEQAGADPSCCDAALKTATLGLATLDKDNLAESVELLRGLKDASENRTLYHDTMVAWITTNNIPIEQLKLRADESKPIIAKLLENAQKNMQAAGVTCSIEREKIRVKVEDAKSLGALEANVFAHLAGLSDTALEIDFVAPSDGQEIPELIHLAEKHGASIHSLDLTKYRDKIDDQIAEKLIKNCRKLNHLFINSDKIKQLPDLSGLTSLQTLDLSYSKALEQLPDLSGLTSLQTLDLHGSDALKQLEGLSGLYQLAKARSRLLQSS